MVIFQKKMREEQVTIRVYQVLIENEKTSDKLTSCFFDGIGEVCIAVSIELQVVSIECMNKTQQISYANTVFGDMNV